MSEPSKQPATQNLGPVNKELHKLLKVAAVNADKSLRDFLEENLGPLVGWHPEDKKQLKLEGVP